MVRSKPSHKGLTLKTLALGAVALLLLTAAGNTVSETPEEPVLRYVFEPNLPMDTAFAHYGAFQTAWLTDQEARALATEGVTTQVIDLSMNRGDWTLHGDDSTVPTEVRDDDSPFRIVQFAGPVKAEWRDKLHQHVDRVYDVVPHHAYLVRMDPALQDEIASWEEVHFVGAYHPAYKLSDDITTQGIAEIVVLTFPDQPLRPVIQEIEAQGGKITTYTDTFRRDGIIKAEMPAANVQNIALLREVSWIEQDRSEITLDNARASAITQSGALDVYSIHDQGVDGRSQVISVCDSGLTTDAIVPLVDQHIRKARHIMFDDEEHPYVFWNAWAPDVTNLHRKIERFYGPHDPQDPTWVLGTPGNFNDFNGHGTHVAGTVAGSVAPYDERVADDGVAYNARLAICDVLGSTWYIASDYTEYWKPAYEAGARINTNSWGNPHSASYTNLARMHDDYVWEHQDFLILRSMGNTGSFGNPRPEAMAKSAMGIGASINGPNMEDMASFSSRGPAADGRIKPNVVAPGSCLNSANTGPNNYRCISGTSMSTPAVAGAAGLIRDYFERGFHADGEHDPSSALVRGLLQMSGKQITGSGSGSDFPNRDQGWGRVLLENVLEFDDSAFTLFYDDNADGLDTGETTTYTLQVSAGHPLRVMLAWNDYPAVAGANPAIVNDLDLEVTGPDGTYIGNAFSGGQTPPNQGSPDRRNVEEAVYVDNPTPGTYTVTVRGANVPEGPQPYALAATGLVEQGDVL